MGKLESLEMGNRTLYSTDYFSDNYNQELYLKRSVDDGSNKLKFYISAFINLNDKRKFLLFKDSKHEKTFVETNIFKNDNYKIIHNCNNIIKLDKIILSFQSTQNQDLNYELLNHDLAQNKVKTILSRHKR